MGFCENLTRTHTGETEKLVELLLEGYDHILDAEDDGMNIMDIAAERGHEATVQFLQSIPNYVVSRRESDRQIMSFSISQEVRLDFPSFYVDKLAIFRDKKFTQTPLNVNKRRQRSLSWRIIC